VLDPERQYRFGSSFSVSFPDFPGFVLPAKTMRLIQGVGKHDIVELYYPVFSSFIIKALKTGVPVDIRWNNDKVSSRFVGYAVSVSHPTVQTIERGVKVMCVGSSYPMKNKESKIWVNKTASEIAVDIANKFNLKPIVTPSSLRFTQQSLAGHSYWEKLNELANRIGYGIQIVETELHFHPIDQMIDQFMTVIPVLSFKDPLTSPNSAYSSPTLDFFEPKVSDFIESDDYSRTNKVVSGVDPITGKTYSSYSSPNKVGKNLRKNTKDPLFSSIETSVVIGSSNMAKSLSDAKSQLSRFSIPATGAGQGDPRIAPWRTIEIRGTGNTTDGFWIVKTAEHYLNRDGRYQVEFTCMSDGTGENKATTFRPSSAGNVPVRNVVNEMTTANKRRPTSSKLTSATAMVTQNSGGFKVAPRRWRGN
jgi:hypothetical protein